MTTLTSNNITAKILKALLITGIALFALYFFAYQPLQIRKEKQNFAKAETSLDNLAKQIEDKVGKPDQIKKDKSCGYASRVSQRGPRGCSLSIYFIFENKNNITATEFMSSVSKLVGKGELQRLGDKKIKSFVPVDQYRGDQSISQPYINIDELSCSVQYKYPALKVLEQPLGLNSPENLQLELSCGGPAMAEYYPIK